MNYLRKNIQAFWLFTSLKFKKTLTFKTNLFAQMFGMFINNMALFTVWWLLIKRFGSINGYGVMEMLLIQGIVAVFYALFFWFFGGISKLGEFINQDKFLDLQLYPVSPLTVLMTKSGSPSQFGDFIQGILFLGMYVAYNPSSIPAILAGILLITFGLVGVMLFFNSLIFYNQKIVNVFTDLIDNIYIGASMYPSGNFRGFFRVLLYGIMLIPIVAFPIEVARGFLSSEYILYTTICVVLVNCLGYFVWRCGVRRVESGNGGGIVE
jgi:ABC-type uncharacterized transport system permease subunit